MTEHRKIVCHASGDRCLGCAHYQGKADECEFALTLTAPAQGAVHLEEASEMSALADEYAKGLKKLIECGYEEYGPAVQRKHSLTIRALRFTASALTSTGLPAPGPHAEVMLHLAEELRVSAASGLDMARVMNRTAYSLQALTLPQSTERGGE